MLFMRVISKWHGQTSIAAVVTRGIASAGCLNIPSRQPNNACSSIATFEAREHISLDRDLTILATLRALLVCSCVSAM